MIRRANVNDINAINDMLFQVHEIHAVSRPDIFKMGAKKYSDLELLDIINDDSTPIYVFTDKKDRAQGYIFCIKKEEKENASHNMRKVLYIDDLCVTKKMRGKGVGTLLYNYVKGIAKNEGFDSIELNVYAFNKNAYEFYKALNMTELKIVMEDRLKDK